MAKPKPSKPFQVNLEWPLILLLALIGWRYGGFVAASLVGWAMLVLLAIAAATLTYLCSKSAQKVEIRLGGIRAGNPIWGPSAGTRITTGLGLVALLYLSLHGYPLAWVAALPLLLEFVPGAPSVWDEYLAEVLRRATVQAGFFGLLAALLAGSFGVESLEAVACGLGAYMLCLQIYLWRWSRQSRVGLDS